MKAINEMKLTFESRSANEGFARVAVSAFVAQLDPTVEEISYIKTAVSEAVTNSIVHGYKDQIGRVYISARIYADSVVRLTIRDTGCGIEDVQKAVEPLYTTCETGERAGMGFAVMEAFTDKMRVRSTPGKGTTVYLEKRIRSKG